MNPFEKPAAPKRPEGERPEHRYVLGAKKNHDGSMDYSRAVSVPAVETAEMDAKFDVADSKKLEERKKRLAIPEHVESGTSTMVSVNLSNAIFRNEEVIENAKEQNKAIDERKVKLLESLRLQHTLLGKTGKMYESIGNNSAADMVDRVEHLIGYYEKLREKGVEKELVGIGPYERRVSLNDLLEAAEELKRRLLDEAARSNNK